MKQFLCVLSLSLVCAGPVAAEEGDIAEGGDLVEQGMRLLFQGILDEMEPELEQLQDELSNLQGEVGPMMHELRDMLGDISNYHMPETLPNGDIIIRRKSDDEIAAPSAPKGDIEI